MADRLITIGIRKYLVKQPRTKRFKKAAGYIRNRVAHYTKLKEEDVKISRELNSRIMKHYSKSMVPVKLNVKIDGGKALVSEFGVAAKKDAAAPETKAKGGARKQKAAAAEPKQKENGKESPAKAAKKPSPKKETG